MKLNRNEHSRLVQWLDRTAEKNPLLWLPCILLIVLALTEEHIVEYLRIVYSHRNTEKIVKEKPQLERKPLALRSVAMSLVVAFGFMFTSDLGQAVYADEYYYNDTSNTDWQNDINVTGSDPFGNMLADEFNAKSNEQEANAGYNVFSVEMQGNTAVVDYEAVSSSTLVVGICDESGNQLLTTGSIEVTSDRNQALVELDSTKIPQYFYIKAYLINTETMRPLCTVYECPTYTQEMQKFLNMTVESVEFKDHIILNLDEDKTNNFAVFNKDTIFTEEANGINNVISVDNDNSIYVIGNANDVVKGLQSGDIYSQTYGNNETLIVKVNYINVVGDTVTIYGDDSTLEDVFDYVKIDTKSYTKDAVVDSSNLEDGISYNGLKQVYTDEPQAYALDVTGGDNYAHSFVFADKEVEDDDTKVTVNGTIDVSVDAYAKLYVSWGDTYVELKLDYNAALDFEFSGSINKSFEVGNFKFSPLPCLNIELTPEIIFQFNLDLKIQGELYGSIGYRCSTNTGMTNISSKPKFKSEIKIDGSFYLGISLDPKITVIHEKVASLGLKGTLGVQVNVSSNWSTEQGEDMRHECAVCMGGDIYAKYSLQFHVNFFSLKYNKDIFDESVKIFDYYASATFGDFGFTKCPHMLYKVKINVVDTNLKKADNAVITVSNNEKYTTDSNGEVVLYLHNGSYGIDVTKENAGAARRMFNIANKPQDLAVYLKSGETYSGELGSNMVKQVSLGSWHSAAVTINGDLYTWGSNNWGQLGNGTTTDSSIPVKVLENVVTVSLSQCQSAAVLDNGDLYTWGDNSLGDIGIGKNIKYVSTPTQILSNVSSVCLGDSYGAAITMNGDLYTWGWNDNGQLGNGTTEDSYTPTKILSDVKSISLGSSHMAAITIDGDLYVWGDNKFGEIGNGTISWNVLTPTLIMNNVKSISLGRYHSSALTLSGDLYAWGLNKDGEIGNGESGDGFLNQTVDSPQKILSNISIVKLSKEEANKSSSMAIDINGNLYAWGDNSYGKLGNGTTERIIIPTKILNDIFYITNGSNYRAAITTNYELYTWGYNFSGQLGNCESGLDGDSYVPLKVMDNVAFVCLGYNHSSAVTVNGDLYMWGYNGYGELGNGNRISSNVPVKINIPTTNENQIESYSLESAVLPYNETPQTVQTFSGLIPREVYNFYGMKSRKTDNPFNSDNLLFIGQAISDSNGNLTFDYLPTENYDYSPEIFVKSMHEFDVPNARINSATISDGSIDISWDAVPNAQQYKVYKVMNGVYTEQLTTSNTSCTITDIMDNYLYGLIVSSCVNGEWSIPVDEDVAYFINKIEHTHLFGNAWKSDATSHWHECVCGEKSDISSHKENDGVVTVEPTDNTEGEMTYSCAVCGYVIRKEPIPITHIHVPSAEYSSDETGHWHSCTLCNEKLDFDVHIENDGVVTVEPTAESEGEMTYSCKECGFIMRREILPIKKHIHIFDPNLKSDDISHWYECECGEKAAVTPHTEDKGRVTVAATVDTEGVKSYYCTVCKAIIRTEVIPVITIDHSCEFDTDWSYNDNEHWQECACGAKENMGGHIDNGGIVTLEPTEESTGILTHSCEVCGCIIRTESIPEIHIHYFAKDWKSDSKSHWHECSCGEKSDNAPHRFDSGVTTLEPTETTEGIRTYTCTVCGYSYTEAVPPINPDHTMHTFGVNWHYDSASHWHECTVCGEHADTERHNENNAVVTAQPTATTAGIRTYYCSVCGYAVRTETILPTGFEPTYPVNPLPSDPTITYPTNTEKEPYIYGDNSKSGWDAIISEIDFVADYSRVRVNMNGTYELPKDVVSHIQNRNINLELNMSNAVWTINGLDVTKPKTVNMRVSERTNKIPESVLDNLSGELKPKEYRLYHSGDFGFKATLTLNVGKRYNDYYAALYHYNTKTKQPEFIDESLVENMLVTFELTHASYYAVAFNSVPMYDDVSASAGVFENSVPIETSAMPETSGVTIPAIKLPQIMKYSSKKRRYRILKKRRLDDLVFVL